MKGFPIFETPINIDRRMGRRWKECGTDSIKSVNLKRITFKIKVHWPWRFPRSCQFQVLLRPNESFCTRHSTVRELSSQRHMRIATPSLLVCPCCWVWHFLGVMVKNFQAKPKKFKQDARPWPNDCTQFIISKKAPTKTTKESRTRLPRTRWHKVIKKAHRGGGGGV